jgi:hypothetical protein
VPLISSFGVNSCHNAQNYVTVYTGALFYLISFAIHILSPLLQNPTEPRHAKNNVFFTGDEVYKLNENIPSTIKYGHYNEKYLLQYI